MRRLLVIPTVMALLAGPLFTAAQASTVPPEALSFAYTNGSNNDGFFTWDFTDNTSISSANVSFPVDLAFTNTASVNYVKALFARYGTFCTFCSGSSKYDYVIDNTPQPEFGDFDSDSGRKGPNCTAGFGCPDYYNLHFRLYADSRDDQQGFDPGWGFYVVGTIHYDVYENTPSAWFGANEQAEGWLADIANSNFPDAISYIGRGNRSNGVDNQNGIGLGNGYGPAWADNTSYIDSNGSATWFLLN